MSTYSTSSLFLRSLWDAGITHVFVNWGSDHPALLEDLERQRIEDGETKPEIVTCPNEMVALSAAQGYAQVTGKPAAVIVHVDVGTQALAGAIHNVDRGRTPVLIYAGASPFSTNKELKGGRNEWIMWLQDIPDQSAIVRQYMRYTAQIPSGSTVSQYIGRALQVATSDPKGPVYLWARRETMEQEVPKPPKPLSFKQWPSVEPSGLSPESATRIASALLASRFPLIITSYIGRNPSAVQALTALSALLSIAVVSTCPSSVNFPFSHPFFAGVTYLAPRTHTVHLIPADTILVIDCDLPWIPANDAPDPKARVFVVDSGDPLRTTSAEGLWLVNAEMVCRADAEKALGQIVDMITELDKKADVSKLQSKEVRTRGTALTVRHREKIREYDALETSFAQDQDQDPNSNSKITVANIIGVLRNTIRKATVPSIAGFGLRTPIKALFLNESISNYGAVWTHLRPELPGSVISSGGSSLGWALGAAVGAYLGVQVASKQEKNEFGIDLHGERENGKNYDLIVAIVGDGSYMFGVPSSAYWMARKYNTPFLTIILNNGGWKSPRLSMLGVHPTGHGSKASGENLTVGFGPNLPHYAQIAVAASGDWVWPATVGLGINQGEKGLKSTIAEAVRIVLEERRCAVVDCVIDPI